MLSFKSRCLFRREAKPILKELSPLKVYPFLLNTLTKNKTKKNTKKKQSPVDVTFELHTPFFDLQVTSGVKGAKRGLVFVYRDRYS